MMTEKEKMLSGMLYRGDGEIKELLANARRLVREYNDTDEDYELRKSILKRLLGGCPENITMSPNIRFDLGFNTFIGENFYANFDSVFLDIGRITIGKNVMFGPRVCLFTAGHPTEKDIRNEQLEYGYPITIGDDVWIGGNTVVNPGVTIGSGTVIGSGSVVTHDIPSGVLAAGNPCRVIRKIGEADRIKWQSEKDKWKNA